MERPTADILHDKDHILGGVNDFVEANNVLVLHFLHEFDFSLDTLATVRVEQLVFLVDFHCDLFVRWFVKTDPNHCIGALPDLLADDVLVER